LHFYACLGTIEAVNPHIAQPQQPTLENNTRTVDPPSISAILPKSTEEYAHVVGNGQEESEPSQDEELDEVSVFNCIGGNGINT